MSSGDTYGQRGIAEFSAAATSLGISVTFGIVVSETATTVEDLLPEMKRLKDNNCRIIQLFGLFKTKLAMEGAVRLDMVGPGYAWLAAEGNLNGQVGPSDDPADAVYQRAAQGIIGTLPSSGDGLAADQKFRQYFAEKTSANDSPSNNYYDWKDDGVPNGYGVPYTYDAVWMLAHAWHNMIEAGLDVENGDLVLKALQNVSFAGVTGRVVWDEHNNRKDAKFDVIQVYGDENGRLQSKIIGNVDPSAPEDKFLSLTERPTFWDGTTTVPSDGAGKGDNNGTRLLIIVVSVSLVVVILVVAVAGYLLYSNKVAHPWRIKEGEVELEDLIGAGSFGEVYAAQWRGSKVAAKRLSSKQMDKAHLAEFKQEVAVMVNLRHPNVTLFMGAVISKNDLMIISEYMEGGSLYDILHSPKSRQNNNMQTIYSTMTHIARGMNYLHSAEPPIVHNDLKSCNILVDDNQVAKVADFGLTKFTGVTIFGRLDALIPSDKENPPIGSLLWAPPEVLSGHEGTPASDVFSFAVIFWEMLTHSNPWPGMLAYAAAYRVMEGQRLEIPRNTPPRVAKLLRRCWAQQPRERPSMAECLQQLSAWSKDGKDRQRIYYHEKVDMARIEAPAPTGDVTLVFTDVEDSTTLWALAPLQMREALDIHNEIFRDYIHEFGGYEVKTEGDSFMIAFSDAWKAVRFCCEVQEALVDATWPAVFAHGENPGCKDANERVVWNGLRVRMGMHSGQPTAKIDVTSERMDYFGPEVNKAARVGGLPRGGQIYISSSTAEIIAPHVKAQDKIIVEVAGLFQLKGIEESEQCSQVNTVRLQGRVFRPKGSSPVPSSTHASRSPQASGELLTSSGSSLLPPPPTPSLANSAPGSPVGKITIARIRAGSASVASGSGPPPPLVQVQRTPSGTVLASALTSANIPPTINQNELANSRASRKVSDPKTTPSLPRLIRNDTALMLAKKQLEGKDIISIFDIEWGTERLGTGTYGDVYLGKYQGRSVAVKRMHVSHVTHSVMMSFVKEAKMMKSFHHPFILGFIGVVVEETDLCIIMEIAEGGTLMDKLRTMSTPDWSWGLNVLAQVASGVAFLHGQHPPIIHRDLKSANILFDIDGGVKLADFGMAKVKMAQQAFTVAGTPAYSAPELLRGEPYSEAVDVFSFGIIMWEMWTRKDPFGSLPAVKVMYKITSGERPPIPAHSMGRRMSVTLKKLSRSSNEKSPTIARMGSHPPSDYLDLMQDCWQADPKRRPNMATVLNRLMAMGANLDSTLESVMNSMDAMADRSIAEVGTDEEGEDDVDIQ
eukprot:TRINITY_DN2648_c1_g1_i8.p1 TRINITY_DN2648_c1_g1~~TRINITY_DN2648_c1_g1_i8.p1  ORF type:complete len:1287 (-),score=269.70 TRINITY_DN2648_c1_g1_i8:68-3928(-)